MQRACQRSCSLQQEADPSSGAELGLVREELQQVVQGHLHAGGGRSLKTGSSRHLSLRKMKSWAHAAANC